jgi:DNA-binding transcriptional LysR family regulator
MHLQTDYLRTFIALADTKGFTRAGRQVNRSQSAVSMQIKRLEDEIGKKLFERIGKTVKLTAEGNILIKYAMRIVKEHDDAIRALSKPDLEGFVRFGSPEHYTIGILPRLLARFARPIRMWWSKCDVKTAMKSKQMWTRENWTSAFAPRSAMAGR